jgi:beta-carotene 3-hydroxylase
MLTNLTLFLGSLIAMEVVAYLTHRFLMHGPLWFLHRSHHEPHDHRVEKNDLFGLFFAIPSIALIYLGTHGYPPLLWIGLGMTAYGAIYFGFHDVLVHRRLDHGVKPKSRYMKRIVQAHHIHHSTRVKDGAQSFGFLYAPPIENLKRRAQRGS